MGAMCGGKINKKIIILRKEKDFSGFNKTSKNKL